MDKTWTLLKYIDWQMEIIFNNIIAFNKRIGQGNTGALRARKGTYTLSSISQRGVKPWLRQGQPRRVGAT